MKSPYKAFVEASRELESDPLFVLNGLLPDLAAEPIRTENDWTWFPVRPPWDYIRVSIEDDQFHIEGGLPSGPPLLKMTVDINLAGEEFMCQFFMDWLGLEETPADE